jgi:hypothetical protein
LTLQVVVGYGGSRALRIARNLFARLSTRIFHKWIAWRRSRGLIAGDPFEVEFFKRLRRADVFLMVWTTDSPESNRARQELKIAKDLDVHIMPFVEEGAERPPQFSEEIHDITFKRGEASRHYDEVIDHLKRLRPRFANMWIRPEAES